MSFLFGAASVVGEIVRTTAAVAAASQELMEGEPASGTSNADELLSDGSNLPLCATAEVFSTDLSGEPIAQGLAVADWNDPARLNQPNPEEFAIEAACYSGDPGVSYFVEARAVETRTVRFGADEIDFASEQTQVVASDVFLSGAVVVWIVGDTADGSQIAGELTITVTRDGGEILFETGVAVRTNANAHLETDMQGGIMADALTVADLAALGLDEASRDVLASVEREGTLLVLVIPEQKHTYTYKIEQDQRYDLTATFVATLTNAPGQTGLAAVLGRPFANIAAFVEAGLPGSDGGSLQRAVNKAISPRRTEGDVGDRVEDEIPASRTIRPLCGAIGLEALALFASLVPVTRRIRRFA